MSATIGMLYALTAVGMIILTAVAVKRRRIKKYWIVLVNLVITLIYLTWRLSVVPLWSVTEFLLGVLLLGAELLGIVQFIISQSLLAGEYRVKKRTLGDFSGKVPDVDVLICTYNEPVSLVEATVLAALNLDYPEGRCRVWLCDDGHREEMKRMAERNGAGYLSREGNAGAKAGNLNYALSRTEGELYAVLDADMICTREFLLRTVGYFAEPETSFVQTPQVYYNKDMYQRNLGKNIPNEQDFFMREMLEALAGVNAVLHVGTNAVFRRSFVKQIGGYPMGTVTEDMAVGLLLQSAGYRSVFINEALVLGLSVSSYNDLVTQRDRWCRGNIQTARLFHPAFRKGLDIRQRAAYANATLYWFGSFAKMIYIFCPLLYLLTGKASVTAGWQGILVFFVPYLAGQAAAFKALVSDTRSLIWAHYYEVAMSPHMCLSILRELFGKKLEFAVTPKDLEHMGNQFHAEAVLPHLALAAATVLAWAAGLWGVYRGEMPFFSFVMNFSWSLYNFVGFYICVLAARHKSMPETGPVLPEGDGRPVLLVAGNRKYETAPVAFYDGGIALAARGEPPEGEAKILVKDKVGTVEIWGEFKREKERGRFAYGDLDARQRRAVVSVYTDYLRPEYEVKKSTKYL